uniref:Uncharacterized protein n=1 Tax=Glossina brevipalpis TaxID=37001 RepID=A0A1A9X2W3_9MUSC
MPQGLNCFKWKLKLLPSDERSRYHFNNIKRCCPKLFFFLFLNLHKTSEEKDIHVKTGNDFGKREKSYFLDDYVTPHNEYKIVTALYKT